MKNEKVIEKFCNGEEAKNKNLFAERDYNKRLVLYSYGYHFPMAVKLDDGNYVVNADTSTPTTNRHLKILKEMLVYCRNMTYLISMTTNEIKDFLYGEKLGTIAEITESKI